MFEAITSSTPDNPLYVLNWGPLTEVACVVNDLPEEHHSSVVVLSHWTENDGDGKQPYNCRVDIDACDYMHFDRPQGVRFLEFGNSGQKGLVQDCMKNDTRFESYAKLVEPYDTLDAKGSGVDFSDMVTAITLNMYQD